MAYRLDLSGKAARLLAESLRAIARALAASYQGRTCKEHICMSRSATASSMLLESVSTEIMYLETSALVTDADTSP